MMNRSLAASIIGINLGCQWLIYASCYPGGFFTMLFSWHFFILACISVIITIVGFRQVNRHREFKWWRIYSIFAIAIAIVSIWTSFPRNTFFWLTAPAFETNFTKLEKDCQDEHLGLYIIERCFSKDGGIYFITGGLNTHGFAYNGDRNIIISSSSVRQPLQYSPLIGDWELFEDNQ